MPKDTIWEVANRQESSISTNNQPQFLPYQGIYMNKQLDYNRRSFPRQNLQFPVHVNSQVTGREFGQILDMSLEGLRMLCCTPVKRGETYELSFRIPRAICGDELILFEARSIWTCPATRPGTCLSGFKLVSFWQHSNSHVALSSAISEYENYLRGS